MLGRTLLAVLATVSVALAQLPTSDVDCGGNKYTPAYITSSINAGVKYLNNGKLQGMHHSLSHWGECGLTTLCAVDTHLDDYPHEYYQ